MRELYKKMYKALELGASPMNLRYALSVTEEQVGMPAEIWIEFLDVIEPVLEKKAWYLVEYPDQNIERWQVVYGEPNGEKGVGFNNERMAIEFLDIANDGKFISTPIGFHSDECCGCVYFYFSRERQNIVFVCNECGIKSEMLTENVCGDVIGATTPLKDIADRMTKG